MKFKKKTSEQYLQELEGREIIPAEEYAGSKTKILHKCLVCGYEWRTTPGSVVAGHGCPECAKKKIALSKLKTHEQYCNDLKVKDINNVVPVEKYIDDSTKILHKCLVCGYEWKIKPNDVLHKHGCPECAMKRRIDGLKNACKIPTQKKLEEAKNKFAERIFKLFNDSIEVLEEYKGSNIKIKFKCKNCGYIWEAKPNDILNGYGCKNCSHIHSKGERKILKFLRMHGVNPELEKSFDDLTGVNGGKLRFDFYIPEKNLLIEYQGKQHYMSVKKYNGDEGFKQRQIHDGLKREYCKANNINELEISYINFKKIDNILTEVLELKKGD